MGRANGIRSERTDRACLDRQSRAISAIMLELKKIWANRLSVIAQNLKFDEREYREVAATAQHVRWDYHGRFLIELVQNAADQATRAGITDSEIVIVRTAEQLAVLNQGLPLDDEGLRALTSLSYDTKDPALTIGNKGLGFKAVFQVSDAPEVYSAPMAGGGLLADGGYRFAFSPRPLDDPALLDELARVAADFEREDPIATKRICDQLGGTSFEKVLTIEAGRGAPFRFPLPRAEPVLREQISAFGFSSNRVEHAAALVVLPLKTGVDVQKWVDEAIDGLVNQADAAALLFLTGVGTLHLFDRQRCVTHTLKRRKVDGPAITDAGPGHGRVSHSMTRHKRRDRNGERLAYTRRWWMISRTLGRPLDSDAATAGDESRQILQAVASFPGQHWAHVDHATVEVALPVPLEIHPRGRPLGTSGLFCIGLPTQMGTGMPLWVNARFHGNIARKEIDLTQNAYNQILFQEAVNLVEDLIDALKSARDVDSRRLATLALEYAPGSLLSLALQQSSGVLQEDVVLGADGVSFMVATAVALPREQDAAMYRLLSAVASSFGNEFTLPDASLMRNARPVLRLLGASEGPATGPDRRFLNRADGASSMVESVAGAQRSAGPSFWEPFIWWLVDRFPGQLLADQRVLPTGTDALSTAMEKVYASPKLPASSLGDSDPNDPNRLDHLVATRLRLFDERCLAIREPDGVKYSASGTRLRQADPPLLR
ncbi:MAG: hypothetical protein M3Z05_14830, partial [Gemmatimonadota bacterium]|nr:hypothetical protein [Gemmatimonadota bacterium]